MIITISGTPGAGKGTVGRLLANRLGYRYYSIGDLRGKMALERGLTIDELNRLGEKEAFTDREVDEYQREIGIKEDNVVVDGRLSWYFIPNSVKIFLKCDLRTGAERVFKAPKREDERHYSSVQEVLKCLKERMRSDDFRYKKWYGIDYMNEKNYDLVIDTTSLTPEEATNKILELLRRFKNHQQ